MLRIRPDAFHLGPEADEVFLRANPFLTASSTFLRVEDGIVSMLLRKDCKIFNTFGIRGDDARKLFQALDHDKDDTALSDRLTEIEREYALFQSTS